MCHTTRRSHHRNSPSDAPFAVRLSAPSPCELLGRLTRFDEVEDREEEEVVALWDQCVAAALEASLGRRHMHQALQLKARRATGGEILFHGPVPEVDLHSLLRQAAIGKSLA